MSTTTYLLPPIGGFRAPGFCPNRDAAHRSGPRRTRGRPAPHRQPGGGCRTLAAVTRPRCCPGDPHRGPAHVLVAAAGDRSRQRLPVGGADLGRLAAVCPQRQADSAAHRRTHRHQPRHPGRLQLDRVGLEGGPGAGRPEVPVLPGQRPLVLLDVLRDRPGADLLLEAGPALRRRGGLEEGLRRLLGPLRDCSRERGAPGGGRPTHARDQAGQRDPGAAGLGRHPRIHRTDGGSGAAAQRRRRGRLHGP